MQAGIHPCRQAGRHRGRHIGIYAGIRACPWAVAGDGHVMVGIYAGIRAYTCMPLGCGRGWSRDGCGGKLGRPSPRWWAL